MLANKPHAFGGTILSLLAVLAAVGLLNASATGAMILTVSLEYLDMSDILIPDVTGDGIPDVDPGADFKLRIMLSSIDTRGLSGGSVDVTESPDFDLTFKGFSMFPGATIIGENGSIQESAPQLDDIGKGTFIFTPGFANPGPVEFFTAVGTANLVSGYMHFTTAQGGISFALQGGGGNISSEDVEWSSGDLNVMPEPVTLGLLLYGGIILLCKKKHK